MAVVCCASLGGCLHESAGPDPQPDPNVVPAVAAAWVADHAIPFAHIDPMADLSDLSFLEDLVGAARVVALGEATHGTREFFLVKARILRYLVEKMGFDAFAIEATWPEANRLDDYVRHGIGDPAELLSGLYFWTWNTRSVLDMIEWMRAHNAAGGNVGFYGFDMQFPGMAIHNVLRFLEQVDPDVVRTYEDRLSCVGAFANGPNGIFPQLRYDSRPATERDVCHAELLGVFESLNERAADYTAASDPRQFARALHSVRVVIQYEESASRRRTRDAAMAENALWLLDQLDRDSRIVLWAHNFHVSTVPGAMGRDLRAALGNDMRIFGFSFFRGSFTAVTIGVDDRPVGRTTHTVEPPAMLSYESFFATAEHERHMLDLRRYDPAVEGSRWLAGPLPFRAIGCCFKPGDPARHFQASTLADDYDVIIHFERTSETQVLPYTPPNAF